MCGSNVIQHLHPVKVSKLTLWPLAEESGSSRLVGSFHTFVGDRLVHCGTGRATSTVHTVENVLQHLIAIGGLEGTLRTLKLVRLVTLGHMQHALTVLCEMNLAIGTLPIFHVPMFASDVFGECLSVIMQQIY